MVNHSKTAGISILLLALAASLVSAIALVPSLTTRSWDYSAASAAVVQGNYGDFFTSDYSFSVFDHSRAVLFRSRLTIESTVTIGSTEQGIIFSLYSPGDERFIELSALSSGKLRLELAEGNESLFIETSNGYNDGQPHTVTLILTPTDATLEVDGQPTTIPHPKTMSGEYRIQIGTDRANPLKSTIQGDATLIVRKVLINED